MAKRLVVEKALRADGKEEEVVYDESLLYRLLSSLEDCLSLPAEGQANGTVKVDHAVMKHQRFATICRCAHSTLRQYASPHALIATSWLYRFQGC